MRKFIHSTGLMIVILTLLRFGSVSEVDSMWNATPTPWLHDVADDRFADASRERHVAYILENFENVSFDNVTAWYSTLSRLEGHGLEEDNPGCLGWSIPADPSPTPGPAFLSIEMDES